MTKFGELIGSRIPTLIDFYTEWEDDNNLHSILRDVAAALRIKGNPTFIIYKDGEMKWRQTGQQDANTLISLVQQYV